MTQPRPISPYGAKILAECIGEELPPCQAACPLNIPVREKLALMQAGKMAEALALLLTRCPFPGILGRICAHPCEAACTRGRLEAPIAIAPLKRYVADLDPEAVLQASPGPEKTQRLAVVGGGPAGLMAAYELRLRGYPVTLFEAEGALGGALRLYIPEYRLPREVLNREVSLVERLGAEVRLNTRLGRDLTLNDLRRDFPAIFLALGTHKSLTLMVPGVDLPQVLPALAFLKAAISREPLQIGPQVAVIGGGNAAVDVARVARRLGSQVTLICLEAPEEMPALPEEVAEAREEGVEISNGWGVKQILARDGNVSGLELKAVARVFDEEGRFSPTYHEDRVTTREADAVILAVGQAPDLEATGLPPLEVDPRSLMTETPGVFAGGDLVTGPRTAVEAFAAGRRAALAMDHYLRKEPLPEDLPPLRSRATGLIVDTAGVAPAPRQVMPSLAVTARLARPQAEADLGYGEREAREEAARCLSCVCSQCVQNCTFLQHYVHHFPYTEKEMVRLLAARGEAQPLIPYSCHFCGLCQAVCPKDLHAGLACLEVRRELVAAGRGPLPGHRGIRNYVRWGSSPYFTLARPDPATGKARRVFFPGCSLPGHSPHLVKAAYAYLRTHLADTGLMLNCCAAPSHLLGQEVEVARVITRVTADLEMLGAEELICACTHCLHTLKEYLPGLKARSLYEVMAELGPPESPTPVRSLFHVHDACGAREAPAIHEAVRSLLAALGHNLEEMAHSRERSICCGDGGMVYAVDPALAAKMTAFRLSEATRDLITYCATCRARFALSGRPALHVLELLFNPDWQQAKAAAPPSSARRWWQRWRLKRYFQGL